MTKTIVKTMVIVLVLGLSIMIFAGNGNGYGPVKRELNAYFNRLAVEENFNGTVLVAKEGKVILEKGYGMANIEEGIANKPATAFQIASMSKAFASMSIMMLKERGLLSLNDTLDQYIPEIPYSDGITIHHLLNHTSGIYEYTYNNDVWTNANNFHSPQDLLEYFIHEPASFAPGTGWEYCNSAYIVLGIIIEEVSGMPLGDFIKQNILEPLKMRTTAYDPYEVEFMDRRAVGYDDISVYPPVHTMYLHPTIPYIAGAMYSTVRDLYKWDRAMYTEKLVSFESLRQMFTPGLGDYGYGWYIDNLKVNGRDHKHIWHWGAIFGFHSFFSRLVDDKVTIIILRNTTYVLGTQDELRPIATRAAEIVLD